MCLNWLSARLAPPDRNLTLKRSFQIFGVLGRMRVCICTSNYPPTKNGIVKETNIHMSIIYVYNHMGVSQNGGTQQPWVFLLKNGHFGGVLGVPPFKETPIYYIYTLFPANLII